MTCVETFATLRIFSAAMHPTLIGQTLSVEATNTNPIDPSSKYRVRRETNYWNWSTQHRVNSADNALHIAALLEVFGNKQAELKQTEQRLTELEAENRALRQRVETARDRVRGLMGRLSFLEQGSDAT